MPGPVFIKVMFTLYWVDFLPVQKPRATSYNVIRNGSKKLAAGNSTLETEVSCPNLYSKERLNRKKPLNIEVREYSRLL